VAWRAVVVSNPARLTVENDQLVVAQEKGKVAVSLEDIAVLMLESHEVNVSAYLLYRLAEYGILLLACDKSHMPCYAGLPVAAHSRVSGVQRSQLASSLPFRKRCWQAVVVRKIANQAECLRLSDRDGAERIAALCGQVASGDSTNAESRAAKEYFRLLFGSEFTRGAEDCVNSALNYGYAIMRGAVARSLACHGFLLTQGIHHCSELNAFNMADDFMEPLRPVVDLWVAQNVNNDAELSKEHRTGLASLLGCDVDVDGKRQSALRAVDVTAGSLISALRAKDAGQLKLPGLLPTARHEYE